MSYRMQVLEEAMLLVNKYTTLDEWRPGLVDLLVYEILMNMYESDYDNESTVPDFIWRKKPDEVMEHIIDKGRIFDLEFGIESLDEDIRNYLIMNDFIVNPEEVSDEEYQTNLEGK
mgnify:CR=1 FL=1